MCVMKSNLSQRGADYNKSSIASGPGIELNHISPVSAHLELVADTESLALHKSHPLSFRVRTLPQLPFIVPINANFTQKRNCVLITNALPPITHPVF